MDDSDYIPVLIASTGSSLDAEIAGKIPEIKPVTIETVAPNAMLNTLKTKLKSSKSVKSMANSQTEMIPITPPMTDKMIDSNKN